MKFKLKVKKLNEDKQIKSIFNEFDSKIERAKHHFIQILEELENSDELETAEQKISSANTSINSAKLPVIFNKVRFNPGELNLDFGGGKFDNATEHLAQQGVESLVYDPYNRTAKHNAEVLARVRENGERIRLHCLMY